MVISYIHVLLCHIRRTCTNWCLVQVLDNTRRGGGDQLPTCQLPIYI